MLSAHWSRLGIAFAALVLTGHESAAPPTLQATLTCPSQEYVLGEPVILNVTVKNAGTHRIEFSEVVVERGIPEIHPYISKDGKSFQRCVPGIDTDRRIPRKTEVLKPGQAKDYHLTLLYALHAPSRLAFDEPRAYWIKVRFPSNTGDPRAGYSQPALYSNVAQIRVKEPQGIDAKVWQTIRAPEFLFFLQSSLVPLHEEELALMAAKLLQSHPEQSLPTVVNYGLHHEQIARKAAALLQSFAQSSYHSALRQALNKYYRQRRRHMTRAEAMEDPDLEQIRSVLGIEEAPEGPFPEDGRLDVLVTYHCPQLAPLEEVFKQISGQSGVPLRLAPELQSLRVTSLKVTLSLRRFMKSWDEYNRVWVRDGDGYRLVPAPEPGEKRSARAKSNDQQRP